MTDENGRKLNNAQKRLMNTTGEEMGKNKDFSLVKKIPTFFFAYCV